MKTRLLLAFSFFLFVFLSGCIPGVTVKGDGNLITENVSITSYDRISVNGGKIVVNYVQSADQPALTVTTDKNIFEQYEFVVESGKLTIKPKELKSRKMFLPTEFTITTNSAAIREIRANGNIKFNINSPVEAEELEVKIAGSGLVNMPELLRAQTLSTELSGSGRVEAADLCVGKYEGDISGSGTLVLAGESDQVRLSIAGSGKIKAFDLQTRELSCSIAGSGNIQMSVSEKIKADIAGSGVIRYKGDPGTIEKSIAGSGSIKPAKDE